MIEYTADGGIEMTEPEKDCGMLMDMKIEILQELHRMEINEIEQENRNLRKKIRAWAAAAFAEALLLTAWILQAT